MVFFPWSTVDQIQEEVAIITELPHLFPPDALFRRLRLFQGLPLTLEIQRAQPDIILDPPERQFYPEEDEVWLPNYFLDADLGNKVTAWRTEKNNLLKEMRQVRGYRRRQQDKDAFKNYIMMESARTLLQTLVPSSLDDLQISSRFTDNLNQLFSGTPEPVAPAFKDSTFVSVIASNTK